MENSYAVIRKFTPPTCTLELLGQKSPLSRWSNKIVLKDVRFKLSFDDPRILEAEPVVIKGDREELDTLYNSVLVYTDRFLTQSFVPSDRDLVAQLATVRGNSTELIDLQPKNLVSHQLTWLSLSGGNAVKPIELSATQLFDLVTALEEYKSEMMVLSALETQQKQKPLKILPLGLSAAGILLAVGLTTFGIKVANNQQQDSDSVAVKPILESVPTNEATPRVIAPQVPEKTLESTPELQEDTALSSSETLPPPPSVNTPKPPPDIPDPALYPPQGDLQIPPIASFPDLQPPTTNGSVTTQPAKVRTSRKNQVESQIVVPNQPATQARAQNETVNNNSQRQVAIAVPESQSSSPINSDRLDLTAPNSLGTTNDSTAKASSQQAIDPNSKIAQLPQQAEIETFLQQKWQPPAELKRTLEYRLLLASDGSLTKVIALGKTSATYLNRTGIPLQGTSFVSPLENRDSAIVRLLLSPDGEVKTFVE